MSNILEPDARIAALQERVSNQGADIAAVREAMSRGFESIEKKLTSLSEDFVAARRPQWPALSVMMGAVVILGGLAYWPIRETTVDLKGDVIRLTSDLKEVAFTASTSYVPRQELEWRAARSAEDRSRMESGLISIAARLDTMTPLTTFSDLIRRVERLEDKP